MSLYCVSGQKVAGSSPVADVGTLKGSSEEKGGHHSWDVTRTARSSLVEMPALPRSNMAYVGTHDCHMPDFWLDKRSFGS